MMDETLNNFCKEEITYIEVTGGEEVDKAISDLRFSHSSVIGRWATFAAPIPRGHDM